MSAQKNDPRYLTSKTRRCVCGNLAMFLSRRCRVCYWAVVNRRV